MSSTQIILDLPKFPYEIQQMIAWESLLHTKSIVVGRNASEAKKAGEDDTFSNITWTCTAFHRKDMQTQFYAINTFELVGTKCYNFFDHKYAHYIANVEVRTWSLLRRWDINVFWLVDALRSLKNLQKLGLKVNDKPTALRAPDTTVLSPAILKKLIKMVCRACRRLEVIYVLVEHPHANDFLLDWTEFLESAANQPDDSVDAGKIRSVTFQARVA